MILVDTSVWIDYFNGVANPHTDYLDQAIEEGIVAMGDLILLEILQGFKSDKDYKKVKAHLQTLDQYNLFGESMVEAYADNYRKLRKKGFTIRKTAEVIIASFCIKNNFPLLFLDKDFKPFVKHLKLRDALQEA